MKDFEVIVVDDGSTDETESILKPFLNSSIHYHKKQNEERAIARNTGAMLARGTYINFVDSDDLLLPHHLAEAQKLIKENNQPEWFHLGYRFEDIEQKILRSVDKFTGNLNKQMIQGNLLSCNGVFIRRDILLHTRFNEDRALSVSEDYELWLRLSARYKLYYSNIITSILVNHEERSVMIIQKDKLINRIQLLQTLAWSDYKVKEMYGAYEKAFFSDNASYIALHLAITPGLKKEATHYLLKSFFLSPPRAITTRRFWATIKKLVYK